MAGAVAISSFKPRRLTGLALLLASGLAALTSIAPASAADCKASPKPEVDWSDCNKSNIVLKGASLAQAGLSGTDFTMTDLRGADLASADLQKATLIRSSLAGADATGANFSRAEAYRTSFAGMQASKTSFASAELQRADFSGAKLSDASFEKAELGRANFEGAVLDGARFNLANLSRANLTDASLQGAVDFENAFMYLARIEGLDLSSATGLVQEQIDLTCGDAETKLPAGLTPAPGWPCTFD